MANTRIYLVRHGETDWNVQGILQGHTDVPLNERGVEQAGQLREAFKGVGINAFHASDLARARHTAEIVASVHGKAVTGHVELRERNLGIHQGKPKPESVDTALDDPSVEPVESVRQRFHKTMVEIARSHEGETVLVVAHSGSMRRFLLSEELLERDSDEFMTALKNGSYVEIDWDGSKFHLVGVGSIDEASEAEPE
ncbi:MAG: alpha-ribazole phosphatase [Candidatus Saccharibacteria bacterium]|nr:alpha-ribazole phosphatase [Candidatus Saccharibacteria bacterium]